LFNINAILNPEIVSYNYYKMFRTISKNPPETTGKKADEKSMWGKATHFNTGDDNEFIGAKSSLHRSFVDYGV
jgi:hypothetical protein